MICDYFYFLIIINLLYLPLCVAPAFVDVIAYIQFTQWMIISQFLFYLYEFLVLSNIIKEDMLSRKDFINIVFAPSVSVLSYWAFVNVFSWPLFVPWYLDIFIHLINIILLIVLVLIKYKNIGYEEWYKNILYSNAIGILYIVSAFIYTQIANRLIYTSNFFSFQTIDGNISYWWIGLILIFLNTVIQYTFKYICDSYLLQKNRSERMVFLIRPVIYPFSTVT